MFICCVGRPRRNWDGKIGCFPVVKKVEAIRNSRNRPSGTMVTKPMNVTAPVYKKLLVEKILPAIIEKFPRSNKNLPIIFQDDNAPCHSMIARNAFVEAAKDQGLEIIVKPQPARSPDFNVLDLGFFNSIQSLRYKSRPKDIDDLLLKVQDAFEKSKPKTLDNVF